MEKQECPKCGKSYSAKGIITHIKFCKPTLSETSGEEKLDTSSDIPLDCTDANDVSVSVSKDASTEDTEQSSESKSLDEPKHSDSYYINYLIIIILAIVGAIIFFIKTGSLKCQK